MTKDCVGSAKSDVLGLKQSSMGVVSFMAPEIRSEDTGTKVTKGHQIGLSARIWKWKQGQGQRLVVPEIGMILKV